MSDKIKSIELKCHRCLHKWKFTGKKLFYLGKFPVYAQCPVCKTSVKVKGDKNETTKK